MFNWLRFWFGSLCFSFLGVPTPRHMQLSAHVCSCPPSPLFPFYLPRMGHLCDVPCKILQLLASERARSNFDASLTRVDSRAGILAPLPSADWRVTCIWVATLCGGGTGGVRSCSPPCVVLGLWLLVLVLRFLRLLCFHILLCSLVFVFVCFAVCFLLCVCV